MPYLLTCRQHPGSIFETNWENTVIHRFIILREFSYLMGTIYLCIQITKKGFSRWLSKLVHSR